MSSVGHPAGPVLAALVCAALAGCASGSLDRVYSSNIWVEPGKYEFLKCPDLAKRSTDLSDHEKKVVSLMERANQEAVGPVLNVMVYQTDLQQTRANIEAVQQTAHEKGCGSITPSTPPSTTPHR